MSAVGIVVNFAAMELRDLTHQQFANVKSLDATRWIAALTTAITGDTPVDALALFKAKWPHSPHLSLLERSRMSVTQTKATVLPIDGSALVPHPESTGRR